MSWSTSRRSRSRWLSLRVGTALAGLEHLLLQGSTLIFTFYTKREAVTDLARFLEHCDNEVEVLARCAENNMRSHIDIRDLEQESSG